MSNFFRIVLEFVDIGAKAAATSLPDGLIGNLI